MPIWVNKPPDPTEFAGLRLLRVPPAKSLEGIVTSHHLVGAFTHFAHRRTQPCSGHDCSLCADAVPSRWHGYISIWSTRTRTQAVLELTALAAAPVADYDARQGTLRGATIVATRQGNRPNSPVTVTISPTDIDLRQIPRPIVLEKFLSVLWSIPLDPPTELPDPPAGQTIRNALQADPPASSADRSQFPLHPAVVEAHKRNGDPV